MWNELDAIVTEVAVTPGDRALVLKGAEGNFSAGADLSGEESNGLTGHGPQLVLHEMRIVGGIIGRLKGLPMPTIAAVDGVAVGVALGIALACDLVIATDRARFMEVFVKRGLALDGGTSWTLPRLVGPRRAKQMAFFGETVDAATALEWGLINEVVAPEELDATAAEWGHKLAAGPTTAISLMKTLIDGSATATFEEARRGRGPGAAHRVHDQGHAGRHPVVPGASGAEVHRAADRGRRRRAALACGTALYFALGS